MNSMAIKLIQINKKIISDNRRIVIVVIGLVLILLSFSIVSHLLHESIDAFVSSEALWSKSQKDAVNLLNQFINTGEESDYNEFINYTKIPQMDRLARLELLKEKPNFLAADKFFIDGGNHPDEVRGMAYLFYYGRNISFIVKSREIWELGDQEFTKLIELGEKIKVSRAENWTKPKELEFIKEISFLNKKLTVLEIEFSETLETAKTLVRDITLWLNIIEILCVMSWILKLFLSLIKTKKDLQVEMNRFSVFINGVNQAAIVVITDSNRNIIFANEKFCKTSGFKIEELIGQNIRIINSGAQSKAFYVDLWDSTLNLGKVWCGELCNRNKDGNLYWISNTIVPLYSPEGKKEFLSISFDITNQKKAEDKLIYAAKMVSLGEMSSSVAHEINNPLSIISGSIDLIGRHRDNPQKLDKIVGVISKSCARIVKIISGLKKFSRSDEKLVLKHQLLNQIIRDVLVSVENKLQKDNIPIICDIKADFAISCDEFAIEQVLVNLVNNSAYAVKDLAEKWIKISVFETDSNIVLCVFDSGPGIDEKIADRIFEPFFTTKEVGQGTGLGLALTKGILEEHQATIRVLPNLPNTGFEILFQKSNNLNNDLNNDLKFAV